MSEPTLYSVLSSQDGPTVRLGWISWTTGITYCGICLGSAVRPRLGELCEKCGACVVGVFEDSAGWDAIRQAWGRSGPAPDLPAADANTASDSRRELVVSKQRVYLRRPA